MSRKPDSDPEPHLRLRRHAEAHAGPRPAPTDAATLKLLHELQVHRIELEMQNAELRDARAEAGSSLQRYTELFDLAPVGYFTLQREGTIRKTNLAAASVLGGVRLELENQRFGLYVSGESRALFDEISSVAYLPAPLRRRSISRCFPPRRVGACSSTSRPSQITGERLAA